MQKLMSSLIHSNRIVGRSRFCELPGPSKASTERSSRSSWVSSPRTTKSELQVVFSATSPSRFLSCALSFPETDCTFAVTVFNLLVRLLVALPFSDTSTLLNSGRLKAPVKSSKRRSSLVVKSLDLLRNKRTSPQRKYADRMPYFSERIRMRARSPWVRRCEHSAERREKLCARLFLTSFKSAAFFSDSASVLPSIDLSA
mmetsp:Transcript_17849/g.31261  ORF Transcript_17849/g.31261 Transcript_17849/m.31261 type:complete len:200 (+) Transcript_17849:754-1353(+)